MNDQLCLTHEQMTKVFAEWHWQVQNFPEKFIDEADIAELHPLEYGERQAKYFRRIFDDLNASERLPTP